MTFSSVTNVLLVAFAFGFVIFWHELGHFLAARWAGVRVEQFAVGMGQAIFSWRKGIGFRLGNTQAEFESRVKAEFERREQAKLQMKEQLREPTLREQYDIARDIGLGETDYRFNWIPLGGYVKPTGQDDLRPAVEVNGDDPHSFGAKPVSRRMVIISAGVIMNVILAFALYVALFLHGFTAPPAVVGQVTPGSPAQAAGVRPGDRIVSINGRPQQDYTKLRMNVALLSASEPADVVLQRADSGKIETVQIRPAKTADNFDMPAIGVVPAFTVECGSDPGDAANELLTTDAGVFKPDTRFIKVGDIDVSKSRDAHVLVDALNAAAGRPVSTVLRTPDGIERSYDVRPSLMPRFGDDNAGFAGMQPRLRIEGVRKDGPAYAAGVRPDDVIAQVAIVGTDASVRPPSREQFLKWTADAGEKGRKLRLTLDRDGKELPPIEVDPSLKLDHKRGIGVLPDFDLGTPVIAAVAEDSPAAQAGIKPGERITSINGSATATWADVLGDLRSAGTTAEVALDAPVGPHTVTLKLSPDDHAVLTTTEFTTVLPLAPLMEVRRTTNPVEAAAWGYEETKQSLFQVYITIRRLFEGSVPLSNLSGPVGIFTAGTSAASRGIDMLIWFTALISANLAVVNFLPIPIVDGGLFTFLLMEKVTGRPPSPRVQAAAQIVGIVLLGFLFLFVTYHDILRQWG